MQRVIFCVFLLLLGSSVLGATVFRDQVAQAIGSASGTAPVTEQNLDSNGFIRVHDQGTVNVALTATGSTVKLDPTGNTVSLSATDRAKLDTTNTHLGNIESQANKLNFDGSGNLETAPAPAAAATKNFFQDFSVDNDASEHNYDLGKTIKASLIVVAGVDDNVDIRFKNGNTIVLVLEGSGLDGADSYTIPLSQPLTITNLDLFCSNNFSNCDFNVAIAGS